MSASRSLARVLGPAKGPAAFLLLVLVGIQVAAGASIAKRSLSALARTSQLPHSSNPAEPAGPQDHGGHSHNSETQKRSELQEEAIREELLRQRASPAAEALLAAIMEADQYENGVEDKRSLSSLARYGNLPAPAEDKRSLSSLARYGNLPAPADDKRSLASLAREGNYPISQDDKRSLAALVRGGNLPAPADDKRSLSSLARYGNLPAPADDKRSLSSLARYGNLPAPAADKRSLEALARGGLLAKNSRVDAGKRSLSALAKAGELPKRWRPPHQREQAEDLLDHLQRELEQTKRGLSSLVRAGSLPRAVDDSMAEKRSLQSLARTWSLPEPTGPKRSPPFAAFDDDYSAWGRQVKRNAAALLRQTKFTTGDAGAESHRDEIESERQGQGRRKRSLWDDELLGESASPYLQSTTSSQDNEWDGLPIWSPSAWGAYFGLGEDGAPQPAQQKRFLGRIPNMGRHRQKTNEDSPRRRRPH